MNKELVEGIRFFFEQFADWSLVLVTLGSAGASIWLAILAYGNGKLANRIAYESAQREAGFREAAAQRSLDEERLKVAFAMSLAINAEDYRTSPSVKSKDRKEDAAGYANQLMLDALAHINLASKEDPSSALHTWFLRSLRVLRNIDRSTSPGRADYRKKQELILSSISSWGHRAIESSDLPSL